jgi:mannosyl-oligosaccharide glucosidase
MNYLALSALKNYYASRPGPYQAKAQTIYQELRSQLVTNMYNVRSEGPNDLFA